jgi:hypothetical protein
VSKAFTSEEAPQGAARCPRCGRTGGRVEPATVEAQVAADARAGLGSEPHFCATPGCEVGYFDALGQTVPAAALRSLGYPKQTSPGATICYCLEITVREVTPERLAAVRAGLDRGEGRCDRASPTGRRCTADIVRLLRAARG